MTQQRPTQIRNPGLYSAGATTPIDWDPIIGAVGAFCDLWKQAASCYLNAVGNCLAPYTSGSAEPDPSQVMTKVRLRPNRVRSPGPWVSTGLRALGWGPAIQIQPEDVRLDPQGDSVFVTVSFKSVSAEQQTRTVVYQGRILHPAVSGIPLEQYVVTVVKPAFSA